VTKNALGNVDWKEVRLISIQDKQLRIVLAGGVLNIEFDSPEELSEALKEWQNRIRESESNQENIFAKKISVSGQDLSCA
jgi:hypothetical protein